MTKSNIFRYGNIWGHAVAYWLRHYATRWKFAGSRSDEVNFKILKILKLGPEVYYSASNRKHTNNNVSGE
jgi:hypothetical protein